MPRPGRRPVIRNGRAPHAAGRGSILCFCGICDADPLGSGTEGNRERSVHGSAARSHGSKRGRRHRALSRRRRGFDPCDWRRQRTGRGEDDRRGFNERGAVKRISGLSPDSQGGSAARRHTDHGGHWKRSHEGRGHYRHHTQCENDDPRLEAHAWSGDRRLRADDEYVEAAHGTCGRRCPYPRNRSIRFAKSESVDGSCGALLHHENPCESANRVGRSRQRGSA